MVCMYFCSLCDICHITITDMSLHELTHNCISKVTEMDK